MWRIRLGTSADSGWWNTILKKSTSVYSLKAKNKRPQTEVSDGIHQKEKTAQIQETQSRREYEVNIRSLHHDMLRKQEQELQRRSKRGFKASEY